MAFLHHLLLIRLFKTKCEVEIDEVSSQSHGLTEAKINAETKEITQEKEISSKLLNAGESNKREVSNNFLNNLHINKKEYSVNEEGLGTQCDKRCVPLMYGDKCEVTNVSKDVLDDTKNELADEEENVSKEKQSEIKSRKLNLEGNEIAVDGSKHKETGSLIHNLHENVNDESIEDKLKLTETKLSEMELKIKEITLKNLKLQQHNRTLFILINELEKSFGENFEVS